jgi:PhzF family phenazine biosynthesis protein
MKIKVDIITAFSKDPNGGNPAGVVLDANQLNADQMAQIAKEVDLSETAFILQPNLNDADVKLRYFTRDGSEVDFCGHATVASLYWLAEKEILSINTGIKVEINNDLLEMRVVTNEKNRYIEFSAPKLELVEYPLAAVEVAKKLDIEIERIPSELKIFHDKNLNYLYVPIRKSKDLLELNFDFERVKAEFNKAGHVVICLYAEGESDQEIIARGLAPLVGVNEDPFTGSMQAGLIESAGRNGMVDANQEVKTFQGQALARPGEAHVNKDNTKSQYLVRGTATKIKEIELDYD